MNRREELIEAAKDLNKVLGLAPEIDVSRPLKDIVEDIREAAQLITDADKINEATKQVIKGLVVATSPESTIPPASVEQGEGVEKGEEAAPKGRKEVPEEKKEKPTPKVKEKKEKPTSKSAIKAAVALLQAGKSREEAENEIHKRYLDQGADDTFARKRAKNLVMTATRMIKDVGEA